MSALPVTTHGQVTLHCLPETYDPSQVAHVIDTTTIAVSQWLGEPSEPIHMRVILLEPNDPMANPWQRNTEQNHGCTGRTYYREDVLLIIGHAQTARFWSVLRHEVAHAVVHRLVGHHRIAFWFDEGVASLYEAGVDQSLQPVPNAERKTVAQYLARTRHSLHLKRLIQRDSPALADGHTYARAWAGVAYLHSQGIDPKGYVQAIQMGLPNKTAFDTHFLLHNASLTSFDRDVTHWVLQPLSQ